LVERCAIDGGSPFSCRNENRVHDWGNARKTPIFVVRRRKTSSLEGINRGFPDAPKPDRLLAPFARPITRELGNVCGDGIDDGVHGSGVPSWGPRSNVLFKPSVPPVFELESELFATRPDDASVGQDVYEVRHDVVQQPLIVSHQKNAAIGAP